ncbi:hypothetical protein [Nonlabens sp. Asnod2-A12]|uniref:hypothetical protein n=1 Tax=Nonlabens sp. Asnod2-A12 TaxID=3160578 RepID=UPI003864722D
MLEELSPITILAIVSLILAVVFYSKRKAYIYVLGILFINVVTEISLLIATVGEANDLIFYLYNQYVIIHQLLWLLLIVTLLYINKKEFLIPIAFALLQLLFVYITLPSDLHVYCFLVSFVIYLGYYLYKHYKKLSSENLSYFSNSTFILLSAPLIYFFSLAFIFGFRESEIREVEFFGFYFEEILSRTGSFIFYILIIVYIFKLRKEKKILNHV